MKYIFCVLIFVFQSTFLFCVDYILQEPVFKSNRACSMADAVFSNPIGIDSLLYNPAGLSEKFYSKNEKTSNNNYGIYSRTKHKFCICRYNFWKHQGRCRSNKKNK